VYDNKGGFMAMQMNKLKAKTVQHKSKAGYHSDGGGLYLQVKPTGSKSWLFRFMLNGKPNWMGLGSVNAVTLEQARIKAAEQRNLLASSIDPIKARDARKAQDALADAKVITFDQCATAYIDAHKSSWSNAKHADQWTNTLNTYASPVFGSLPVQDVDTDLVMKVLDPIWQTKTETATRLRSRIELVLDWAKVRGYRAGENPARWRGHIDKLLPKRSKVAKVKHHAALPYADITDFMMALHEHEGVSPIALEAIILTAARVSELVNAKKDEIDYQRKVWTIPAGRMKAKRLHRVPLSDAALKLFKAQHDASEGDYLFPGLRGEALTGAACLNLLDDMGYADLTTHGFRSTFRDWAAEQTNYPRELAEAALAHVLKDKTEAAYQRGDLLEKRRLLMQEWANYCTRTKSAKVLPMRRKA
jgi:integrase